MTSLFYLKIDHLTWPSLYGELKFIISYESLEKNSFRNVFFKIIGQNDYSRGPNKRTGPNNHTGWQIWLKQ